MGSKYKHSRQNVLYFNSDGLVANQTRYFTNDTLSAADLNVSIISPITGILRHLYAEVSPAPGVGETCAFTVMVQGIASALAAQIADAALQGNDLVNGVPVLAGQRLSIRVVNSLNSASSIVKASLILVG